MVAVADRIVPTAVLEWGVLDGYLPPAPAGYRWEPCQRTRGATPAEQMAGHRVAFTGVTDWKLRALPERVPVVPSRRWPRRRR